MSYRDVRKDTNKILELLDEEAIDAKQLCKDLLRYMSEADVHAFCLANDCLMVTGEDDE